MGGEREHMRQIVQSVRNGELSLMEAAEPTPRPGTVVIANAFSLISAGTERMVRGLAQKSLLGKARERPDHVRRVLEKLRNEGLVNTVGQVRAKLDERMPMGYSSAGVVFACGEGVEGFKPGERVASNGPHAEVVCVPKHLCARVPDGVPLGHAAFTVLGAIALQGVRLARVELGSTVFVIGLGLVGQLTVALLKASGVRVVGADPDEGRCEMARRMGASLARPGVRAGDLEALTGGLGADAVIITAATKSNEPIELAANAVRKKGRIVLVGVVGLELDRRPFYFKECEFVVSCSYGPGRYDPLYEERGIDYPPAYVRWTEQRNMQAVLQLMAEGSLDVSPLISHRFPFERALDAYELIEEGSEPYLGVVFEYPRAAEATGVSAEAVSQAAPGSDAPAVVGDARSVEPTGDRPVAVGVVGAGSFAKAVLLPAVARSGLYEPVAIASASGLSAAHVAGKMGFARVAAREEEVLGAEDVHAVLVLTRHSLHARQVVAALGAGKHVFAEKPLALDEDELEAIEKALAAAPGRLLMVGFNRRFSPAARAVRRFFEDSVAPVTVSVRMNAGAIPPDHWVQDPAEGGRIVGEACHAIDLATYLTGSPPVRVFAESVGGQLAPPITDDQCFITLRHANGSVSSIAYLAGGDRAFPKERVEVIGGGRVAVIEDFRKATGTAAGRTRKLWAGSQDKGHPAEVEVFARAIQNGGKWPITWEELKAVARASFLAVRSLREGRPFAV